MEGTTPPGNPDATCVLKQYPTPRALHQALQEEGPFVIPRVVQQLPWNEAMTIGEALQLLKTQPRLVARLYALLQTYATEPAGRATEDACLCDLVPTDTPGRREVVWAPQCPVHGEAPA